LEVTVRPASNQEIAALAFFSSEEERAAALGADGEVQDIRTGMRRWEEFVEQFPHTPYTPYVRFHLGTLYLNGTSGSRDPLRAAQHFRLIAEAGPAAIADDALIDLAKSQIEAGRFEDADATITTFLSRFPENARKPEVIRMRDGLRKGFRSLQKIFSN
jgi:outer membrane protein assembly factor BamD (BamD/ComL family)